MRILLCNWKDLAHPAAGGAEVYTHEVLRRWAAAGHEIIQFAAAIPGRPGREIVDGIEVVRDGGRAGVYAAARRFYEAQGPGAFDLAVDEINTRPFDLPRFVRGTPVVALAHQVARELWFSEFPLPLAAAGRFVLEPWWLRAYRDVPTFTVSASSRDSLLRYGLRRVEVAPQGTDVPLHPAPGKEATPTLLFVGRLTRGKRPEHALEAFRLVRSAIPLARLWVVGCGPLERRLRARAERGVTFHGWVSEERKRDLMARAHALVVTSVREGWGLVVDEAAAMGTRSIAYDVPGLRDSVPAAGGVLVRPTPKDLAEAIRQHVPGWAADPPRAGWRGGAAPWDDVARTLLRAIVHATGLATAGAAVAPAGAEAATR